MKKLLPIVLILTSTLVQSQNTESPYKTNTFVDLSISIAGTAGALYGFKKLTDKPGVSEEKLNELEANFDNEVPKINQIMQPTYSKNAATASDVLFYGSPAVPLLLLIDKNIRANAAQIGLLYWQAQSINGAMYALTSSSVDKFRPLAYTNEAPLKERMKDGTRNSFYGGHPTLVATSLFFMGKVIHDYYPSRKGLQAAIFSFAGAASLATGYLRMKAGKHFLSDVLIGLPIGVLNGLLVPHFHKKNRKLPLKFSFFSGEAHGLSFAYNIR